MNPKTLLIEMDFLHVLWLQVANCKRKMVFWKTFSNRQLDFTSEFHIWWRHRLYFWCIRVVCSLLFKYNLNTEWPSSRIVISQFANGSLIEWIEWNDQMNARLQCCFGFSGNIFLSMENNEMLKSFVFASHKYDSFCALVVICICHQTFL